VFLEILQRHHADKPVLRVDDGQKIVGAGQKTAGDLAEAGRLAQRRHGRLHQIADILLDGGPQVLVVGVRQQALPSQRFGVNRGRMQPPPHQRRHRAGQHHRRHQ